ncbi:MRC1-like domain-containing protein [Gaertneriomyces semiglobifer]|nr:MRC1-like domain-containing protein [Gaertneriomyces semiglobifer]
MSEVVAEQERAADAAIALATSVAEPRPKAVRTYGRRKDTEPMQMAHGTATSHMQPLFGFESDSETPTVTAGARPKTEEENVLPFASDSDEGDSRTWIQKMKDGALPISEEKVHADTPKRSSQATAQGHRVETSEGEEADHLIRSPRRGRIAGMKSRRRRHSPSDSDKENDQENRAPGHLAYKATEAMESDVRPAMTPTTPSPARSVKPLGISTSSTDVVAALFADSDEDIPIARPAMKRSNNGGSSSEPAQQSRVEDDVLMDSDGNPLYNSDDDIYNHSTERKSKAGRNTLLEMKKETERLLRTTVIELPQRKSKLSIDKFLADRAAKQQSQSQSTNLSGSLLEAHIEPTRQPAAANEPSSLGPYTHSDNDSELEMEPDLTRPIRVRTIPLEPYPEPKTPALPKLSVQIPLPAMNNAASIPITVDGTISRKNLATLESRNRAIARRLVLRADIDSDDDSSDDDIVEVVHIVEERTDVAEVEKRKKDKRRLLNEQLIQKNKEQARRRQQKEEQKLKELQEERERKKAERREMKDSEKDSTRLQEGDIIPESEDPFMQELGHTHEGDEDSWEEPVTIVVGEKEGNHVDETSASQRTDENSVAQEHSQPMPIRRLFSFDEERKPLGEIYRWRDDRAPIETSMSDATQPTQVLGPVSSMPLRLSESSGAGAGDMKRFSQTQPTQVLGQIRRISVPRSRLGDGDDNEGLLDLLSGKFSAVPSDVADPFLDDPTDPFIAQSNEVVDPFEALLRDSDDEGASGMRKSVDDFLAELEEPKLATLPSHTIEGDSETESRNGGDEVSESEGHDPFSESILDDEASGAIIDSVSQTAPSSPPLVDIAKVLADAPREKNAFVEDQAEESEDEFFGLAGDDEEDHLSAMDLDADDAELVVADQKLNVEDQEVVRELARLQEWQDDEKAVEELLRDVTTGNLRKRKARRERLGRGFLEDSDEEDERILERLRARWNRDDRHDKDVDVGEGLERYAKNPETKAFAKAFDVGRLWSDEEEASPATLAEPTQVKSDSDNSDDEDNKVGTGLEELENEESRPRRKVLRRRPQQDPDEASDLEEENAGFGRHRKQRIQGLSDSEDDEDVMPSASDAIKISSRPKIIVAGDDVAEDAMALSEQDECHLAKDSTNDMMEADRLGVDVLELLRQKKRRKVRGSAAGGHSEITMVRTEESLRIFRKRGLLERPTASSTASTKTVRAGISGFGKAERASGPKKGLGFFVAKKGHPS